jgi:oligopeptide/dipeptide ABC transporter ATP-binding protein
LSTLELSDVVVDYERRGGIRVRAVAGASVSVDAGQIVGLVGESGCGKSTLARAAVGLVPVTSGSVRFEGRDVTRLTRRARSDDLVRLQLVFQNPYSSLNPRRKVGAQISDGLTSASTANVAELCELVGLPANAERRYPHEFSGGQRQRIAIARALAPNPALIVADEPLSALDVSIQSQVLNLMRDVQQRRRLAYLFISHDMAVVNHLVDRVAVLYLGRLVEIAPRDALFARPSHPYTQALLDAVPRIGRFRARHRTIQGEMPSPLAPPPGCVFHPRCTKAQDICRVEIPALLPAPGRPAQLAACHFKD